jgi:predicted membrane channel-forming protein YqfA (hemolysin III family)
MSTPQPLANIWLTYKTRINSERRYLHYEVVSYLAMSWYSFICIVYSIYQYKFYKTLGVDGASQASLVMSVLTFGLSLVIYGFKFGDCARVHRDCYLRMQSIYQSRQSDEDKIEEYRLMLDQYPNHADRDYQDLLFDAWKAGEPLQKTDGEDIKFGYYQIIGCQLRHLIWHLFVILVFGLPPVLGYLAARST